MQYNTIAMAGVSVWFCTIRIQSVKRVSSAEVIGVGARLIHRNGVEVWVIVRGSLHPTNTMRCDTIQLYSVKHASSAEVIGALVAGTTGTPAATALNRGW